MLNFFQAATQIERIVRGFIARRRVRAKAREYYSKFFEAKGHKFYYMNNMTGETFWDPSPWLMKQVKYYLTAQTLDIRIYVLNRIYNSPLRTKRCTTAYPKSKSSRRCFGAKTTRSKPSN